MLYSLPLGTSTSWQSNGATIFSDGITYDAVGNVISRATTQASLSGVNGSGGSEVQNFCYDEQNRLVWAGNSGTQPAAGNGSCGAGTLSSGINGAAYATSYVYTHLGQLWQGPLNGTGTQEQYLYCASGQPHQVTLLAAVSSSPTCSTTSSDYSTQYDAWGNVTSRTTSAGTGTFSYDGLDRLRRWNGTTATSSQEEWYLYDASGNRVLRRSASTASGGNPATAAATITVYAFGLEEHQYQYSGTGSSMTTTNNTYYYMVGGRLLGMLSGVGTQTTSFLLTDTLGSITATISNTAGNAQVMGNQVYGPYGNQRATAGTTGTAKGFTGQYHDDLTGLDYYVARYYDPLVGLFLSADNVQGNLQGFDPYTYVDGNPETYNDPTGEFLFNPATGQGYRLSGGTAAGTPITITSFQYMPPASLLTGTIPQQHPPVRPKPQSFIQKIVQAATNIVNPASLFQSAAGAFRNGVKNVWKGYLAAAKTDPAHASDTPLYRYLIKPLTGGQGKITVDKRSQTLQNVIDRTEGISQTIDMLGLGLNALGGVLDGISSGTTYYQAHPGQGVARAVWVGVAHGVLSTAGSIIGGISGEAVGAGIGAGIGSTPVVTDEVTTPAGAVIGGIAGAAVGSYVGSVDGDQWASWLVGG